MAQDVKAPSLLAGAHCVLGLVSFATGQFQAAREHLERAVETFGDGSPRNYGDLFAPVAPGVLGAALTILGYPLMALSRANEFLTGARRSSEPYSIVYGLFSDCMRHVVLRDYSTVAELTDEMLSIATEQEMAIHLVMATFLRGWVIAATGRADEGIADMRRSVSDPMVADAMATAQLLIALVETCGQHRRAQEGLDLVAEGLQRAEQSGLRTVEAELHRVKGELLIATDLGKAAEAERCLRTAIDIARRQGARLFELRAITSLARLLKAQSKTDEARGMLAEIYNWFTEGFEVSDLEDAKALLEELRN